MPYLIKNDYKTYIQGDYLRQLQQGDDDKRVIEENVSLQVIAQKLKARFDLNMEFTETKPYSSGTTYGAMSRITVDFGAPSDGFVQWVTATSYAAGDMVINESIGYICAIDNDDMVFTPANWTTVGAQYTIYYGAFPSNCTVNGQPNPATLMQPYAPVFNYKTLYTKGDIVFWRGFTYVCNQSSAVLSHQSTIQYELYSNLPYNNVFPDDPVNNATGTYWNEKTDYSVQGAPITDAFWIRGDNRNQTIKDAMVRITVFKLSPLLAPRNRPESWLEDYRSILRELNEAAEGKISMALPQKQPQNNLRTWYTGAPKQINNT